MVFIFQSTARGTAKESREVAAFRGKALDIYRRGPSNAGLDLSLMNRVCALFKLIRDIGQGDKDAAQKKLVGNHFLKRIIDDEAAKERGSARERMNKVGFFLQLLPHMHETDKDSFKETRALLVDELHGAVQKFAIESAFVEAKRASVLHQLKIIEWVANDRGYGEFIDACQKARRALMPIQENVSEFLNQPQDNLKTRKMNEKGKAGMEYANRVNEAINALSSPYWTECPNGRENVGKMVEEKIWGLDGRQLKDLLDGKTIRISGLKLNYNGYFLEAYADFGKDLMNLAKIVASTPYTSEKMDFRKDAISPNSTIASQIFVVYPWVAARALKQFYLDVDAKKNAMKMISGNCGEITRFYNLASEASRGDEKPSFRWLNSFYNLDDDKDIKPKEQALKDMNKLMEIKNVDRNALVSIISNVNSELLFAKHKDFLEKLATLCGRRLGAVEMPGVNLGKLVDDKAFNLLLSGFESAEAPLLVALYYCDGVAKQKTLKSKAAEIQKRINVLKQFGFEYVERLDPVLLENFYRTATGTAEKFDSKGRPRKLALIVLNKDDWNGAFKDDQAVYHSLIDKGYNMLFCEAGSDMEVAERFFNYGRRGMDSGKSAHFAEDGKKTGYDLLILGGHGEPSKIKFGGIAGEWAYIDLQDYAKLKKYGDWESLFTDRAAILLWSCSTGGKLEEGKKSDFSNMMTMLGDLTAQATYAPKISASTESIKFDTDGYVVGTEYDIKGIGNVTRHAKVSGKK